MVTHEVCCTEYHYAIIDIEPESDKDTILNAIGDTVSMFTREYIEIKYCKRVSDENKKR